MTEHDQADGDAARLALGEWPADPARARRMFEACIENSRTDPSYGDRLGEVAEAHIERDSRARRLAAALAVRSTLTSKGLLGRPAAARVRPRARPSRASRRQGRRSPRATRAGPDDGPDEPEPGPDARRPNAEGEQ